MIDLSQINYRLNLDTNLKASEKMALHCIVQYYEPDKGFSSLTYNELKLALSTTRNDTVSNNLKSLVKKGYITIGKEKGNRNIYFLHKYLELCVNDYRKKSYIEFTLNKSKKFNIVISRRG